MLGTFPTYVPHQGAFPFEMPHTGELVRRPIQELNRPYDVVQLSSADGNRVFRLEYDQNLCLTPDQITRVQGQFAAGLVSEFNMKKVWELGIGSGVFPAQMLLELQDPSQVKLRGFDIDPNALAIAHHNLSRLTQMLGLPQDTYSLSQGDWLSREPIPSRPDVDMIYANPPYLPPETPIRPEFERNPWHSLFAYQDGMQHFATIIRQSQRYLKPGGFLFLRTSKKPELAQKVEEMVHSRMPASTVERVDFQAEHRQGVGFLIRYYPSEV